MNNNDTSGEQYEEKFYELDECLPHVVKNSDLMVTDSGYRHSTDEDMDNTENGPSIQFIDDLEEIEAENDLYYNLHCNQQQTTPGQTLIQAQFQRQLFKNFGSPGAKEIIVDQEYELEQFLGPNGEIKLTS